MKSDQQRNREMKALTEWEQRMYSLKYRIALHLFGGTRTEAELREKRKKVQSSNWANRHANVILVVVIVIVAALLKWGLPLLVADK